MSNTPQQSDLNILKNRLKGFRNYLCRCIDNKKQYNEEKEFVDWISQLSENNTDDLKKFFLFIDHDISPIFNRLGNNKEAIKNSIKSVLVQRSGLKNPNLYDEKEQDIIFDTFKMFHEINTNINTK
jgi:hypothetical protein